MGLEQGSVVLLQYSDKSTIGYPVYYMRCTVQFKYKETP